MTFLILIDTDLWIDFFSGAEPGAAAVERLIGQRRAALSVVTVFELFCGATRPAQIEQLERMVGALEPVTLTCSSAQRAGQCYLQLRRQGRLIGNQDLMIAATALELGIPILSRNRPHFGRISALEVLSPEEVLSY
ncbi:MAG: type II toxin-antitoxin system VapC family toxin [Acidobacteriota bacterium]